jgi:hypothetical protein
MQLLGFTYSTNTVKGYLNAEAEPVNETYRIHQFDITPLFSMPLVIMRLRGLEAKVSPFQGAEYSRLVPLAVEPMIKATSETYYHEFRNLKSGSHNGLVWSLPTSPAPA